MSTGAAGPGTRVPQTVSQEAARARLTEYLASNGNQRHLVCVAAKLGLADLLAEGPRSSDDLAAAEGAHADTLRRVLRGRSLSDS